MSSNYDDIDDMEYELPVASTSQPQAPSADNIKQMMQGSIYIYPVYFDKSKSTAQGRRVNKEWAMDEPSVLYLGEAAQMLRLSCIVDQRKRHPKDPLVYGCLRIPLKQNGNYAHPTLHTKQALLIEIAKLLPQAVASFQQKEPKWAAMVASSRSQVGQHIVELLESVEKKDSNTTTSGAKKKGKKKK